MKNVIDALISGGQNVKERELILLILDGIRPKFDPVVVHITLKLDEGFRTIILGVAKVILQRHEQRMLKYSNYGFSIHEGFVNVANKVGERDVNNREYRNQRMHNVVDVEYENLQHGQGRSRGKSFKNRAKVICQVSRKSDHVTLHCYYKFDITYVGNIGNSGGYRGSNFQSKVKENEYIIKANFGTIRYFGENNSLRQSSVDGNTRQNGRQMRNKIGSQWFRGNRHVQSYVGHEGGRDNISASDMRKSYFTTPTTITNLHGTWIMGI